MPAEKRWLTTAETARRLGVKPETIYAYVSRGLMRSRPAEGRRGSLFDPDDVDRLTERRQGRSASGAMERIRTELTLIVDDELFYRGHRVTGLARTHRFEAVARLLWGAEPASADPFAESAGLVEVAVAAISALPADVRLTDRVRVAVAAVAAADPLRYDLTPAAVVRRAESLLAVLVTALGAAADPAGRRRRDWPPGCGRPCSCDRGRRSRRSWC